MPGQQEPDIETDRRIRKVEKDVTAAVDETSSIEDVGDADGEGEIVSLIRKASAACAVRQLAQYNCMQVLSRLMLSDGPFTMHFNQTACGVCCPTSSSALLHLQEQDPEQPKPPTQLHGAVYQVAMSARHAEWQSTCYLPASLC